MIHTFSTLYFLEFNQRDPTDEKIEEREASKKPNGMLQFAQ